MTDLAHVYILKILSFYFRFLSHMYLFVRHNFFFKFCIKFSMQI